MTNKVNGNKALLSVFIGMITLILTGMFMIRNSDLQLILKRFDALDQRLNKWDDNYHDTLIEIVQRLAVLEEKGK